jgi:catechol 2,3-dioxygenase-like lactoylglutathione lyase family enzyme
MKKLCTNLHHVSFLVENLDTAFARYETLLGLHGEKYDGYAVMRCTHEDYSLVLRDAQGQKPYLDYVAYELEPSLTLAQARQELETRGEVVQDFAVPQRGAALLLNDPDRNRIVLVERKRTSDPRPPVMIQTDRVMGFHPKRLGHINYLTDNVQRAHDWYTSVLGFQLTDWIGDEAFWLHIDARHHVVAFLQKGFNHIHHIAYELVDFSEMRAALDHVCKHGRHVTWGPGRHGMAQNLFSYWRMWEEELFIELYTDMQILEEDHVPFVHPDTPFSSNTWGILPPRTYFRFDEEAIKQEREQTFAYKG